jgi:hypothetical protein
MNTAGRGTLRRGLLAYNENQHGWDGGLICDRWLRIFERVICKQWTWRSLHALDAGATHDGKRYTVYCVMRCSLDYVTSFDGEEAMRPLAASGVDGICEQSCTVN